MQTRLDWSAYENNGGNDPFSSSFGDPFGASFGAAPTAPPPGGGLGAAAALCVGDRQCLRADMSEVMCPSYRVTGDPAQSPEGRVAALRAALGDGSAAADLGAPSLLAAMDSCVGCKGCKRECPRGVDVAQMATEVRAGRVEREGLSRRAALFARLPALLARFPHTMRLATRLRNAVPLFASLGERLFGIPLRRSLPVPVGNAFAAPEAQGEGEPEVLLFVDSFTRNFEPEIAVAALEVLRAGGYRVEVLAAPGGADARPLCCGRTLLSSGLVDEARAEATCLVAALGPALERGLPVVGLEPSCLLMLRDEYHSLGLGPEVAKLGRQAFLLEEFLARELDAGRLQLPLRALDGPPAVLHGHCHQKAFGAMGAVHKVLAQIPGFRFEEVRSSCCGMAGSFGLEAEHADLSLAMAEQALLPAVRGAAPDAPILADGFSCRHQIQDGAGRRAEHVALLLRRALAPA